MDIVTVEGTPVKDLFLYTLSTCGWCRKTKAFLRDAGVAFRYVDVDLASPADQERLSTELRRWNPASSFPTIVVDGTTCMVGFDPERLRAVLGL
jgi:glutaredoxin-like protein NrdH